MPTRRPRKPKASKPPTPWEAALAGARQSLRHWDLATASIEGPALIELLATHPVVLGIHGALSKPNITRVLRPGIVRRAVIVTEAGGSEAFAVALETPGILVPSGPKRKDASRVHWLVCLPAIPGPRPEPVLVRVPSPDLDGVLALAVMYRTPPGDVEALGTFAT